MSSHGERWHLHIYEIKNGIEHENGCAIICLKNTATPVCHYYLHVVTDCYFGNFNEGTILGSTNTLRSVYYRDDGNSITVIILQPNPSSNITSDINLLTGAKDKFQDFTRMSGDIWPKYVYTYHNGVVDERMCATRCFFYSDNRCHFYYYTGSRCYFGDFNSWPHSHIGTTNAPIRFLPNSFGKTWRITWLKAKTSRRLLFRADFRAQVAGKGGGCGGGFFEVTSTSWSISVTRQNYASSELCEWYIYNPQTTGQLKLEFSSFDVISPQWSSSKHASNKSNSFQTESCCDELSLYAGPGTNGNLIWGPWAGLHSNIYKYFNSPMVVISWSSDSSITGPGFVGTLRWVPWMCKTPYALII